MGNRLSIFFKGAELIVEIALIFILISSYIVTAGAVSLRWSDKFLNTLSSFSAVGHVVLIILRAAMSGHGPFSNMYESLIFFSGLLSVKLVGYLFRKKRGFFIIIAYSLIIIMLLYAAFLPYEKQVTGKLVPALDSVWFYIHVPAFFVGYVSGALAFAFSIHYLLKPEKETLRLIESEVKATFFFITVGMFTGAIWGYYAWSDYWSFDPKENWSFVTWLTYALYFHAGLISKHEKFKPLIVVVGFLLVIFTYIGVTYLFTGLHSYT